MVKKIISKVSETKKPQKEPQIRLKRGCVFCQSKTLPIFTDALNLRKFLTDRNRIIPKVKSGLCSKHQRKLTKQIKYARHLALLPFTPKV